MVSMLPLGVPHRDRASGATVSLRITVAQPRNSPGLLPHADVALGGTEERVEVEADLGGPKVRVGHVLKEVGNHPVVHGPVYVDIEVAADALAAQVAVTEHVSAGGRCCRSMRPHSSHA
jgi:hypothetical protein